MRGGCEGLKAGGGPGRLQGNLALNLGGQRTWRKPEQRTRESRGHALPPEPQGTVGLIWDRLPP